MIRQAIILAICCMTLTSWVSGQSDKKKHQAVLLYELYSWQAANGDWRFAILPSPSGPNISADEVFDKRVRLNNVKELKRKVSELPVGSTIIWLKRIADADEVNEKERVGLPPSSLIEDLQHYAEARTIKVDLPTK
jgi:hypothetical protein